MCSCIIEFIKQVEDRGQMRGLPSTLSLFRKEFNKLNYTGARMLVSNQQTSKACKNYTACKMLTRIT